MKFSSNALAALSIPFVSQSQDSVRSRPDVMALASASNSVASYQQILAVRDSIQGTDRYSTWKKGLKAPPPDNLKITSFTMTDGAQDSCENNDGFLTFRPGVDAMCGMVHEFTDVDVTQPHILIFCTNNPDWSKTYADKCKLAAGLGDAWTTLDASRPNLKEYNNDEDDVSHDRLNWCYGSLGQRQVYIAPSEQTDGNAELAIGMACVGLTAKDDPSEEMQDHEPLQVKRVVLTKFEANMSDPDAIKTWELPFPHRFADSKHSSAASNQVVVVTAVLVVAAAFALAF